MKKTIVKFSVASFLVVITFLTATSLVLAASNEWMGGGMGDFGYKSNSNEDGLNRQFEERMYTMMDIVHFADIDTENLDNGVLISIRGDDERLIREIQKEFNAEQLKEYFKTFLQDVELEIEQNDTGTNIIITSQIENTATLIQENGRRSILNFIMNDMHSFMHGRNGMMNGNGMMHGREGMMM